MPQLPTRQRYVKPALRGLGRMADVTRKSTGPSGKTGNARDHSTWEKNRSNQ